MRAARSVRGLALGAVAIVGGAARFVAVVVLAGCRALVRIMCCCVELRDFLREFCLFRLRFFRLLLLKAGEGG